MEADSLRHLKVNNGLLKTRSISMIYSVLSHKHRSLRRSFVCIKPASGSKKDFTYLTSRLAVHRNQCLRTSLEWGAELARAFMPPSHARHPHAVTPAERAHPGQPSPDVGQPSVSCVHAAANDRFLQLPVDRPWGWTPPYLKNESIKSGGYPNYSL